MTLKEIFSIPRSLYYNIKLFGFRGGVLIPIFISNSVKLKGIRRGKIIIKSDSMYRGMINIGFGGSDGISKNKEEYLIVGESGRIVFNGTAGFGSGSSVRVDNGELNIGTAFSCNKNCFISCTYNINIGNNVLIGWNVNIRDTDGHTVFKEDSPKPSFAPVNIGNNIWIASFVDILKGVSIADNCIVGYRSCVIKSINEMNCLVAGYPAKVIQRGIKWKA